MKTLQIVLVLAACVAVSLSAPSSPKDSSTGSYIGKTNISASSGSIPTIPVFIDDSFILTVGGVSSDDISEFTLSQFNGNITSTFKKGDNSTYAITEVYPKFQAYIGDYLARATSGVGYGFNSNITAKNSAGEVQDLSTAINVTIERVSSPLNIDPLQFTYTIYNS